MLITDTAPLYQGMLPWLSPGALIAATCGYLASSAVIAAFYAILIQRSDTRFNAVLALSVVLVSGTLALQLWSTPWLWR